MNHSDFKYARILGTRCRHGYKELPWEQCEDRIRAEWNDSMVSASWQEAKAIVRAAWDEAAGVQGLQKPRKPDRCQRLLPGLDAWTKSRIAGSTAGDRFGS